jgi:hypothetical protein
LCSKLEEIQQGTVEKIDSLHLPPKGYLVEQQRMDFYLDRAAQTRLHPNGHGKKPSSEDTSKYIHAMKFLMSEVDTNIPTGGLRRRDFGPEFEVPPLMRETIWSQVNKSSSPGFPFTAYPTNEDVGISLAFDAVEEQLRKWWLHKDIFNTEAFKHVDREERCRMLIRRGLTPPVSSFIKGEPTSKEKVARVIYGTSLVSNIISLMIYGTFLEGLKDTWYETDHKVGLDMYTEEGLSKFKDYLKSLFHDEFTDEDCRIMSSDVQGWEYQVRDWMFKIRVRCYIEAVLEITSFYKWIINYAANVELYTCVIDSAGYVHCLPFYITFSGKRDTHYGNSFDRAALARLDEDFINDDSAACTNGDDCLNRFTRPLHEVRLSEKLGFITTDRSEQTLSKFNFCSQEFTLDEDGRLSRRPESIGKIAYNYLSKQDSQLSDIVLALNWPEAINALFGIKKVIDSKLNDSARVGAPAFRAPNETQTST